MALSATPDSNVPTCRHLSLQLQRGEADLCVGGIRQTVPYSLLATSTHNYHQTSVRFGVLDLTYELSSLDILLYPYPMSIWLAVGIVLAVSILMQLLMDRLLLREPGSIWLNLELIFVGMPMMQTPRFVAKRVYCVMLMLYTLLIRTVYQGMLYHLIRTHQLNRLPQSIDELVAHNYTVVLSSAIHDALTEIPTVQHMHFRIVDGASAVLQPLHHLAAHPYDKRQVAATVLDVFRMYNRLSAYEAQARQQEPNHFELISQDVINMQLTMYLRKHSFLIDEFNDEIMWMRSVGLLAIWARWELDESYSRAAAQSYSFRMFGLQQLNVVFLLVLLGLGLSTLVFGLELLSLRSVRLQRWFLSK